MDGLVQYSTSMPGGGEGGGAELGGVLRVPYQVVGILCWPPGKQETQNCQHKASTVQGPYLNKRYSQDSAGPVLIILISSWEGP